MNETTIIISVLAILFSLIALIVSLVGIAMVCGFLRSTHTVAWKPIDPPEFFDDSDEGSEPLKPNKPKDYAFMDDVADQNNF